jgi:hypothetical protein
MITGVLRNGRMGKVATRRTNGGCNDTIEEYAASGSVTVTALTASQIVGSFNVSPPRDACRGGRQGMSGVGWRRSRLPKPA